MRVMRYLTREEIVTKRKELFTLVNGDVFFSLSQWPSWARRTFWEKPLSDEDSFKMMLFLIGNGLDPRMAGEWVMLSQHWCGDGKKMEKRARQIDWVIANVNSKAGVWFYFDIYHQKILHMNGDLKRHC